MPRAIDCLVNVDMGDMKPPEWMLRVKEDTFKGGDAFLKSPELAELIDDMDANGVERAILLTRLGKGDDRARRYARARPERFSLGVGNLDLLRPMPTLRELASFVRDHPVSYAVVGPSWTRRSPSRSTSATAATTSSPPHGVPARRSRASATPTS